MRISLRFVALTPGAVWLARGVRLISIIGKLGRFAFWGSREEGQDWREGKDLDFVPEGEKQRDEIYGVNIQRTTLSSRSTNPNSK